MAILNPTQLGTLSQTIATNTAAGSNTAAIVGGLFQDIVDSSVFTVKVSLTSAEILALFTTPKVLVAAQGANTVIVPIRFFMYLHYGTVTYATNTNLILGLNTVFQATLAGAIGFSADEIATYTVTTNGGSSTPTDSINTDMLLSAQSGNPTLGDSTLDVYLTYQVISI